MLELKNNMAKYEFMSKEKIKRLSHILDGVFKIRLENIKLKLGINAPLNDDIFKYTMHGNNQIGQELFGIKDTLKPIEEYIADIKEHIQCLKRDGLYSLHMPSHVRIERYGDEIVSLAKEFAKRRGIICEAKNKQEALDFLVDSDNRLRYHRVDKPEHDGSMYDDAPIHSRTKQKDCAIKPRIS